MAGTRPGLVLGTRRGLVDPALGIRTVAGNTRPGLVVDTRPGLVAGTRPGLVLGARPGLVDLVRGIRSVVADNPAAAGSDTRAGLVPNSWAGSARGNWVDPAGLARRGSRAVGQDTRPGRTRRASRAASVWGNPAAAGGNRAVRGWAGWTASAWGNWADLALNDAADLARRGGREAAVGGIGHSTLEVPFSGTN
ncbi:MAG: hypothetical protein LBE08_03760 [Bifidobacteriaceae bacterium]|nr:hypothetical protein [Bifidobacteriaceae bacterium]